MARKPRIHYQNAIYHVIARGNNKEPIFFDSEDKAKYLSLINKYKSKYNFELYAYVFMDNHVHLLICVNEIPLSKIMQGIQQTYTLYFNKKYQHVGHVFQQRYKAFICDNNAYLLKLVCYIHQNPLRARISETLEYDWSSHKDYMTGQGKVANPAFILHILSDDANRSIQRYAEMVSQEQPCPEEVKTIPRSVSEITKSNFIEYPQLAIDGDKTDAGEKPTFEELASKISKEKQVTLEQLLGKCRIRKVVEARKLLIYQVVEAGVLTRAELAKRLSLDPAVITRGYQQVLMANKQG